MSFTPLRSVKATGALCVKQKGNLALLNIFKRRKENIEIYTLLPEPVSREVLGVWAKHMWHYEKVIGYSATGAIFLYAPETNEYLVFYPSMPGNNCKRYGAFERFAEFESKILKDSAFPEYCLYPIDVEGLRVLNKKLGPLEEAQIYYPALDPALGGSIELEAFTKGNVWVRTEILGQNRGIE